MMSAMREAPERKERKRANLCHKFIEIFELACRRRRSFAVLGVKSDSFPIKLRNKKRNENGKRHINSNEFVLLSFRLSSRTTTTTLPVETKNNFYLSMF